MFERVLRVAPARVDLREASDEALVDVCLAQESVGDESAVVWDAALVLAYFLQWHPDRTTALTGTKRKRRVLELGAGTGAVGIVAAVQG